MAKIIRESTDRKREGVKVYYKVLVDGRKSAFLTICNGGKRNYECLHKYLLPEKTPADRIENKRVKAEIEAAKNAELARVLAGDYEFGKKFFKSCLLSDWLDSYQQTIAGKSDSTKKTFRRSMDLVNTFAPNAKLADVDKDFIIDFTDYLCNDVTMKSGKPISRATARQYINFFSFAIKSAYKQGYIKENPFVRLEATDKIKAEQPKRVYLDEVEVQKLIDTPCKYDGLKRAFMFSCFCGLRLSDIKNLTWGDLKTSGDRVNQIKMRKTQRIVQIELSDEALYWLPERGKNSDKVFSLPSSMETIERQILRWSEAAQIDKHITFHTARHTFATMLVSADVDLYVVSKLLGHSNIQVTQIYADIVGRKKREAVNMLNGKFTH